MLNALVKYYGKRRVYTRDIICYNRYVFELGVALWQVAEKARRLM